MSTTTTPSPGRRAHLIAEHYFDGDPVPVTHHHVWVGYTAADVIREKVAVFKSNRTRYKRVGKYSVERYHCVGSWYRLTVEDVTS